MRNSYLLVLLWLFKFLLSIYFYNELVIYFIFFDIIVFVISYFLDKSLFFYLYYLIFQLTSISLYISYIVESNGPFSYGGDDSLLFEYLNDSDILSLVVNYPLFLYINYLIKDISILIFGHLEFKFLLYINNIVASLTVFNYYLISKKFKLKNFNLIFLFTPFLYFSSLFLRDVYIYLFVSFYFLLLISNFSKLTKIILFFVIMASIFFLRPESSIILPIFELFRRIYNRITSLKYRAVLILSIVIFSISIANIQNFLLSFTAFGFRDVELMKEIYFSNESIGSLGAILLDSYPSIYYLFNLFRPIPPYFFSTPNFENLIQIPGNIFWYLLIITCFINYKKVLKSNPYTISIVSLFLIYIGLISFIGGTSRHYYAFIPFFILQISNIPNFYTKNNNIIIFMSIVFIIALFYILS